MKRIAFTLIKIIPFIASKSIRFFTFRIIWQKSTIPFINSIFRGLANIRDFTCNYSIEFLFIKTFITRKALFFIFVRIRGQYFAFIFA